MLTLVLVFGLLASELVGVDPDKRPRLFARLEAREVRDVLTNPSCPRLLSIVDRWAALPAENRARLAARLVPALHSNARIGLDDARRVIVFYRVQIGEMKNDDHALLVGQDIFLTGGRAAFAIAHLLDKGSRIDVLDGGLTAGEWNKRALAIEAKVKAFIESVLKDAPKKK